jgi:gliding motility-associated-like protein
MYKKVSFVMILLLSTLFLNAQINLNAGLVAYYPFNGNTNDVSGNGNNPVFNNATLANDRFGNINGSYHFNGIDNYMRIPNSPTLNSNNTLSVACWVRVTGFYQGTCHGNRILMKGDADYLPGNYTLTFDDNAYTNGQNCANPIPDILHENFYGLGSILAPGYTPYVQLNQWMSVIYTNDGITGKLYINCELKSSAPSGGLTFTNNYDLFFGRLNNSQYPYWLNGDLDEVRVYNRALNIDEVKDLGGCSLSPCTNWLNTQAVGQSVTVGDLDITGNQITVEANFNRSEPLNNGLYYGHLISKHSGASDANYTLLPNGCEITTTNGYFSTFQTCPPTLNKTYHVAMVYNGSTLKFYRNGYLLSSQPCTGNMVNNDWQTTINQYAVGSPFNNQLLGYTNEVRIWNVARTQTELRTYMNTSLPNPTTQAGLKGYYTFDNLLNKQGNTAFNGTLNGGATINATNPNCNFVADSCELIPQTSCNNWLNTPTYPSSVNVGDLDVTGNQLTVEVNYNSQALSTNGSWGHLVSKHTNTTDVNYAISPNGAEITTTNGYKFTPAPCGILLNKTYHIAMVYDGTMLKFYRNGFLMTQTPCSGNMENNNLLTTIAQIAGPPASSEQFTGYINEVRIWNVARTKTQLQTYMNSSLPNPPTQTGLLGYYTFDNLLNKQGNTAFNGTLNGSAAINTTNPNCNFVVDSCNVIVAPAETIINDYTPVLGLNPCKNIITVGDGTAYNIGDTVLLIQMKGAVIDSTNTAAFGTITDYKSAGNYEYNYVKSKTGNQIELKNKILRTYEIPNGKVQLIRVPYYQDYSTTSTLTCLPWNGTIGGVLVFNVNNTLTLNNNIDVTGRGFRKGTFQNSNLNATNCFTNGYFLPNGTAIAAGKGESITDISIAKGSGKGKLAAAGGGGLDHNSGGGGGGNGGAGGFGGYQLKECGNFPFDNRGIGGINLNASNINNKIFLGSGGGAGHCNNGFATPTINTNFDGGNGGGIVLITTNTIINNGYSMYAQGDSAYEININAGYTHDGMGGGGGGGTILIKSNINNTIVYNCKGGKGGDMHSTLLGGRIGPGGGGGGGIIWLNQSSLPAGITTNLQGGNNGIILEDGDPWGATPGQPGQTLFNLSLPITTIPFKANIDSVRIKDSITSCTSFDFKGLGYINTNPVTSWQWYFGDGATATTQNTSHSYTTAGTYTVKLIITDNNGCTDSITKPVTTNSTPFDFSYKQDICNPLSVQFFAAGVSLVNPYWSFGDAGTVSGTLNPVHTYATPGNYLVKFTINNTCNDTISKLIAVNFAPADIVITPDTTICFGTTKQLRAQASGNFCWSPTTYLNNASLNNPTTSTPTNITYYYTAEVLGNNLITNGDFSQGNSSFTSDYKYVTSNTTEGEYFVGTNPIAWNSNSGPCTDHTTGLGNMLMINGSPAPNAKVWSQIINVVPNTNYTFSLWIQSFSPFNPAQLRFSINGLQMGADFFATNILCDWKNHLINWNSGNNTTAAISIVNRNTVAFGNDFTLDDISFAPVSIKRDSVKITIDTPVVKTIAPVAVCSGIPVQITTTGASVYSWTPPTGLSNTNINNPVATPNATTKYIVTGTTINGCVAKDSVTITILPKPSITKIPDTAICKNTSVQLFATGGNSYVWSPAATLSNSNIYNPVAAPVAPATTYYVTVINTAVNTCSSKDSVQVTLRPDPVFTVSPAASICTGATKQLNASGGDVYLWNPVNLVSNPAIHNPMATAASSTNYSVTITESKCNASKTLFTTITVNQLPKVTAAKSNDVNCSVPSSRLLAGGASKYIWTPSTGLSDSTVYNPISSPRNTIQYIVTGTDALGCANKDSIIILVNKLNESGYYMPNTFTPNNDSKNDCFGIKFWGLIDELQFFIYNRYGERVFYTNNPNQCWDGTFKGQPADQGNYVYYIKAKTLCGNAEKKGSVILLR